MKWLSIGLWAIVVATPGCRPHSNETGALPGRPAPAPVPVSEAPSTTPEAGKDRTAAPTRSAESLSGVARGRIEPGVPVTKISRTHMEVFVSNATPSVAVVRAGSLALQIERRGERVLACLFSVPPMEPSVKSTSKRCATIAPPEFSGEWPAVTVTAEIASKSVVLEQPVNRISLKFETQPAAWQALADVGQALAGKCSFPYPASSSVVDQDEAFRATRCTLGLKLSTRPLRMEISSARGLRHGDPACSAFGDAAEFELADISEGGLCFRDSVIDRYSTAADIRSAFNGHCKDDDRCLICDGIEFAVGEFAARAEGS